MRKTLAAALGVAALAGGLVTGAAGAGADPNGDAFELTCGGTTYDVTTGSGKGEFTPAFDADSRRVFHPTAFDGFEGTVYDTEGTQVDHFVDEGGTVKGSSGKGKDVVECTYLFDEIGDGSDPELPAGYRFVGGGGVTGYWSPVKK